jgi:hypothetical protein
MSSHSVPTREWRADFEEDDFENENENEDEEASFEDSELHSNSKFSSSSSTAASPPLKSTFSISNHNTSSAKNPRLSKNVPSFPGIQWNHTNSTDNNNSFTKWNLWDWASLSLLVYHHGSDFRFVVGLNLCLTWLDFEEMILKCFIQGFVQTIIDRRFFSRTF